MGNANFKPEFCVTSYCNQTYKHNVLRSAGETCIIVPVSVSEGEWYVAATSQMVWEWEWRSGYAVELGPRVPGFNCHCVVISTGALGQGLNPFAYRFFVHC